LPPQRRIDEFDADRIALRVEDLVQQSTLHLIQTELLGRLAILIQDETIALEFSSDGLRLQCFATRCCPTEALLYFKHQSSLASRIDWLQSLARLESPQGHGSIVEVNGVTPFPAAVTRICGKPCEGDVRAVRKRHARRKAADGAERKSAQQPAALSAIRHQL